MLLVEIFGKNKEKVKQTNEFRSEKGLEFWYGWFRTYLVGHKPEQGEALEQFIARILARNEDFQELGPTEKVTVAKKIAVAIK